MNCGLGGEPLRVNGSLMWALRGWDAGRTRGGLFVTFEPKFGFFARYSFLYTASCLHANYFLKNVAPSF